VTKDSPPLVGFNNNVRHRGKIFHIQTEDSGVRHARLVTHLFADGGRIVHTSKTDYSEHVGREDMVPVVRRMMKEQHKGMFIALRGGDLDDVLEQVCGPLPGPPEPLSLGRRSMPSLIDADPPERTAIPPPEPVAAHATPAPYAAAAVAEPPPPSSRGRPSQVPPSTRGRRQRTLSNPNLRRMPPSIPPPPAPLDLDVDALGRAIAGEPVSSTGTLPERPSATELAAMLGSPEPRRRTPSGRYAASRPAAIFSQPPSPERQSLFGEDVISEKSLDEVILSYLAEDLDTGSQD